MSLSFTPGPRLTRLVRRAVLPDGQEDWPDEAGQAQLASGRAIANGLFALICLGAWLAIRRAPDLRREVADVFFVTNVLGLFGNALLIYFFERRRSRLFAPLAALSQLIEIATAAVWVQLTGSTSNYFLGFFWLIVLIHRLVAPFAYALLSLAASLGLQWGIWLLEDRGVLPYASLAGLRDVPTAHGTLRETAMWHSTALTFVFFMTAGLLRAYLDDTAEALRLARRRLRVAEQARLGRHSGTSLGEYQLGELLGRGGMGEVYAARRERDGQEVAIKLLHAHLDEERDMRVRFRRELEVLERMPPGTSAAILDHGTSADGIDYIVMERLRGEDLGALLTRRGRLGLAELLPIVAGVARALDAAHALGVVHRDLKPANIFLCNLSTGEQAPDVRLLDFGVARLMESSATRMTATAAVLGTPGYLAPEQARGLELTGATDLFALGCVLYRALTGDPAFGERHPAAAIRQVFDHQPAPPSQLAAGLPRAIDDVIASLLAVDPALRYPDATAVVTDLEAIVAGHDIEGLSRRAARAQRPVLREGGTLTNHTGDYSQ